MANNPTLTVTMDSQLGKEILQRVDCTIARFQQEQLQLLRDCDTWFSLLWHRGLTKGTLDYEERLAIEDTLARLRKAAQWKSPLGT